MILQSFIRQHWPIFALSGAVIVATVYFLWFAVGYAVSSSYHPMASQGRLGYAYFPAFLLAAVASIVITIVLSWRQARPLRNRRLIIGTVCLLAIPVAQFGSLSIYTSYRQTYWLGEVRHDIPWRYSPYNGSTDPGGQYFLIKVDPENLVPRYSAEGKNTVILSKATGFDYGSSSEAPSEICRHRNTHSIDCSKRIGEFVYGLSGRMDPPPDDPHAFLNRAKTLFD
ncbi:MAG: hypothetical protein AAF565_19145, partial [Pseudomonadota bacterium]